MKTSSIGLLLPLLLLCAWPAHSQSAGASLASVPRLVNFGGIASDLNDKPISGVIGITFAFYKDQYGGAPLWLETQNAQADEAGHYTLQLGATKSDGLPAELFSSGDARWLGIQISGQTEHPRVLLLSVPYALKAADAATLGGLPPSAFVLATPSLAGVSAPATSTSASVPAGTLAGWALPAGTGTTNFIPIWTNSTGTLGNSVMFQSGTGTTAKVGINTTTPATTLDVKGTGTVRGVFNLPAIATATAGGGKNSQPLALTASSFNSGTTAAVTQNFRWQTEPVGNNTTSPSGSLNLLFGSGSATPLETGLKIASNGQLTFATGQVFPGTGPGTVQSVGLTAPSSDFTVSGSPVTSTGTLNLAWTVAPTSANTANTIVKRDATGSFTAGSVFASFLEAGSTTIHTGPVIFGYALSTTGASQGVLGATNSSDPGAYGAYGYASALTGNPKGIYGQVQSPNGVAVFGQDGDSQSLTGSRLGALGAGVWGDGGGLFGSMADAVLGTADDGYGGIFENNSIGAEALYAFNNSTSGFALFAGTPGGSCNVDNRGNLTCSGSKNAAVPIDGGKRKVALAAIESPQNWFEDFGSAQLNSGSALVALDPDFAQTVNTVVEYHVFLTPNADCKGLYISNRTSASFQVRELGGGSSSVPFSYRIVALRKNYENVRLADHTNDPDPKKQLFRHASGIAAKANP